MIIKQQNAWVICKNKCKKFKTEWIYWFILYNKGVGASLLKISLKIRLTVLIAVWTEWQVYFKW